MVLEDKRSETPFSARDNMLDIWKHVTELSFRGFGKRKRKPDKIPKNFETWSEASQERWKQNAEQKASWREQWDIMFINRESNVVDTICRKLESSVNFTHSIFFDFNFHFDGDPEEPLDILDVNEIIGEKYADFTNYADNVAQKLIEEVLFNGK